MEGLSMKKNIVASNVIGNKALLVRKLRGNRIMSFEESQRENIFQIRCRIQGHLCALIIDDGSGTNLASLRMVSNLNFKRTPHPRPYKLQWIKEDVCFEVKEQVTLEFSISNFHDKVVCDVVPMEAHVSLGRSWLRDKRAIHYKDKSKYKLFHNEKWMSLASLSPKETYEDQCELRKKIEQESMSETLESEILERETLVSEKESMSETLESERLESETLMSENERQRESAENTLSANTLSEKQKGELCLNSHFSNHTLVNNVVCLDFQVAQEEVPKGTLTNAQSLEEDKILKNDQRAELSSRPITHCIIGSNYLNMCLHDRLGAALSLQHELNHKQHPRALEQNVHISLLQPCRSFYYIFVESILDPCHNFVFSHASLHLVRHSNFGFLVSKCVRYVHGSNLNLLLEFSSNSNKHDVKKNDFVFVVFDPGGLD